ncbi:MAG: rhomboid family intramembrane serine protease [Nannocystales bacterium]
MRKLCQTEDRARAEHIADGLRVAGIDAEVRGDVDTPSVWVIEHEQLTQARAWVDAHGADEVGAFAGRAEKLRKAAAREHADHVQRQVSVGAGWRAAPGGLTPITMALIGGSVIIALMGYLGLAGDDTMWSLTIDHYDVLVPLQRIRDGEVWRLLTPMFLHFGVLHLVFNMMWMWNLGPQVESNHGSLLMVVLVVVSEVAGNLAQYAVTGPAFGGMSGVVYALFGFVWMGAQYDRKYQYALSDGNAVLMMGWFVLCATGFVGPIANLGHAGGLVVGLLFGLPAYVRQVRAVGFGQRFEKGSWGDVQLKGWRWVQLRVLRPYLPLWFLLLAGLVVLVELADNGLL